MASETSQWSRDEEYYFPDGNVIVLVSSVLFKVHRHILARDGSSFENMFALDAVAGNTTNDSDDTQTTSMFQQDGNSDETPIQLQGDSADDFRRLLWCLYALPQDIGQLMSPNVDVADIIKLVSALGLAHKYHFVSTEAWASRVIAEYLHELPPSGPNVPLPTLVKISEIATISKDGSLLDVVRKRWRRLIAENRHLGLAVITMERLGLRSHQGLAYQALVLKGRAFWEKEPELTREHRIRLLSGFYNLTRFCTQLPDMPPVFQHGASCADTQKCEDSWKRIWRGVVLDTAPRSDILVGGSEARMHNMRYDPIDVMGRLTMVRTIVGVIPNNPTIPVLLGGGFASSVCEKPIMDALLAFYRKTQNAFMDFFEDVV